MFMDNVPMIKCLQQDLLMFYGLLKDLLKAIYGHLRLVSNMEIIDKLFLRLCVTKWPWKNSDQDSC